MSIPVNIDRKTGGDPAGGGKIKKFHGLGKRTPIGRMEAPESQAKMRSGRREKGGGVKSREK